MRNAYALLGFAFLLVFGLAFVLFENAYAPTGEEPYTSQYGTTTTMLTLSSSVFFDNGVIPSQYTCDGENTLPPLTIEHAPEGTRSFVLVMDDPDIPQEVKEANNISKFNHLVLYNISPTTRVIEQGDLSGTFGLNSRSESTYTGPCPPREYEPKEHRYIFRLYALPGTLQFIQTPTLDEVETVAKEQAIQEAQLIGRYQRP